MTPKTKQTEDNELPPLVTTFIKSTICFVSIFIFILFSPELGLIGENLGWFVRDHNRARSHDLGLTSKCEPGLLFNSMRT